MSHLHHWKTLLGARLALKCHCPWRCCPDCVHVVQAALLSFWIEMRAAGSAPAGIGAGSSSVHTWLEHLAGFFCPCRVSGAENSQTQELLGPFSSRVTTLCYWLWYLIICLGTKLFHWGMLWNRVTQKNLPGATSSVQTLHCTPQKRRVPFQQKAWMLVWVTCRNRGWFGRLNFLIRTILEPWADEHFGSFATVGLFPPHLWCSQ